MNCFKEMKNPYIKVKIMDYERSKSNMNNYRRFGGHMKWSTEFTDKGMHIGQPKTQRSVRRVKIPQEVVELMRKFKAEQEGSSSTWAASGKARTFCSPSMTAD